MELRKKVVGGYFKDMAGQSRPLLRSGLCFDIWHLAPQLGRPASVVLRAIVQRASCRCFEDSFE
jgi:hypothetical protein